MKRALLAVAAVVLPPVAVLGASAPRVSAAPGGDVTVVVQSVTWGSEGTATVLCPAGSRALGGGAAPVSPAPTTYASRLRTDGPVDGAGGTIASGEAPGGWQVAVSSASASALGAWKVFVTCSTTSDVVATAVGTGGTANTAFTVDCPSGSRAVGGGFIGSGTSLLTRSGPVGASPDQFGTSPDGTVPTRWRIDLLEASAGGAVVLCSVSADATLRGAALSAPGDGTTAGVATAGCPTGQRAVSGGLTADAGQLASENRLGFAAPVASLGDLASIATGAVPQAWTMQGRGGGGSGYRVQAVCVTTPAPPPPPPAADSTAPDTAITRGPAKKTTQRKASFGFTSEPGATFTCRLDEKPPVACTSPFKVTKLSKGKHTVTVTARDAAGNVDPTPATWTWKVTKKRMPK